MPLTITRHDARPSSGAGLRVVESHALGKRAVEWDALVRRAPLASAFLASWWLEAMATGGDAHFVLCLDSDQLVGGIALSIRRLGPLTFMRMLGDGPLAPDHLDLVAARGREAEVVATLNRWFITQSPCEIDLRGLAEGALVLDALPSGSLVTELSRSPYLQVPDSTPLLPSTQRGTLRKQAKRFDRLGAVHRAVRAGEEGLEDALRDLRRLHVERWGEGSGFARSFAAFATAVRSSRGAAQIDELSVDGEVIASEVSFDLGGRRHRYQIGRSMDRRWRGAGNVLLLHAIHRAQRDSVTEYDFLRGAEPYKYGWATADRKLLRARGAVGTAPRCHLWLQRLAEHGRPAARQVKAWVRSRRAGRRPPSS